MATTSKHEPERPGQNENCSAGLLALAVGSAGLRHQETPQCDRLLEVIGHSAIFLNLIEQLDHGAAQLVRIGKDLGGDGHQFSNHISETNNPLLHWNLVNIRGIYGLTGPRSPQAVAILANLSLARGWRNKCECGPQD